MPAPNIFDDIGSRISQSIKNKGYKQTETSQMIDISQNALSNYINGKRFPDARVIYKLSQLLHVSMEWLLTGTDKEEELSFSKKIADLIPLLEKLNDINIERITGMVELKLSEQAEHEILYTLDPNDKTKIVKECNHNYVRRIGRVAAGLGIEEVDLMSMDDLVEITGYNNVDFALTVVGDSMEPIIPDGSTILIRSQPEIENGEVGIVSINGYVTCKKIYREGEQLEKLRLKSINSNYKDMVFTQDDGDIRIVGKVVLGNNGNSK